MLLDWGNPSVFQIGKVEDDGAVKDWLDLDIPVETTTQLETIDGELKEARGEGGVIVDVKKKKNTYKFHFELFKKKGQSWPIEDIDGKVDGFYAMRLIPEDSTVEGFQFSKSVITVTRTYNTEDGTRKKYTMNVLNETDGTETIKPYTVETAEE